MRVKNKWKFEIVNSLFVPAMLDKNSNHREKKEKYFLILVVPFLLDKDRQKHQISSIYLIFFTSTTSVSYHTHTL